VAGNSHVDEAPRSDGQFPEFPVPDLLTVARPLDGVQLVALAPLLCWPPEVLAGRWDELLPQLTTSCPDSKPHPPDAWQCAHATIRLAWPELTQIVSGLSPNCERAVVSVCEKVFYELVSCLNQDAETAFLNLGWTAADREDFDLGPLPAHERPYAALYERVMRGYDLSLADVVEVGCGRGGGCAWIAAVKRPRFTFGLDVSRTGLDICRARWKLPGLQFALGHAGAMPLPDHSADVVVNIESAHAYASMGAFLSEVRRVLRPGGLMLLADICAAGATSLPHQSKSSLASDIAMAGFITERVSDITAGVVLALSRHGGTRMQRWNATTARALETSRAAATFMSLATRSVYGMGPGTWHERFASGRSVYLAVAARTSAGTPLSSPRPRT
jgi:SAM-dependent methyltransferase